MLRGQLCADTPAASPLMGWPGRAQRHASPSTALLLLDRRDAAVRVVQGNEGSAGHLMAASKHIHLVINMVSSGQPSMAVRAGFCEPRQTAALSVG
jgi:hypothetical protein